jgi:Uma2 family endonuclease
MPDMSDLTKRKATHEDLRSVPANRTGEIIDGELIVSSEPLWKRHLAATLLNDMLAPHHLEQGHGPGGWVIRLRLIIELGDSVLVPDLAGWKKGRFPSEVVSDWISVVPDWVCEILSDDTVVLDKTKKMPIYAQYGLSYLWLIDPQQKSLGLVSVYELDPESRLWTWLGGHFDGDKMRVVPFHETELEFGALFHKHAVIVTKRRHISKSEVLSRLRALLEEGLSDTEPEEPGFPR